jgi:hypothetical protein
MEVYNENLDFFLTDIGFYGSFIALKHFFFNIKLYSIVVNLTASFVYKNKTSQLKKGRA